MRVYKEKLLGLMNDIPTINSGKTILLADDEQFIVVAYRDGLERAGYEVIIASDGEEALLILEKTKPELLLLELMLPKLNGFELLQAMKEDPAMHSIPVLVLTNLSQESDKEEARSYGVADFLVKSEVSLQDLLHRVDQILGYA
jgi:two-component system alkaline phosphatase synthesis response regulator PhoP